MYIQDISQRHVPTLAKLLQFRPKEHPEVLSQRIANGAKSLPSLLRARRWENLLLPARGNACELHNCLNRDVVEAILGHVQKEVGNRLNNIISRPELLAPEQYTRIVRLREIHALWLDRREYRKAFMASSSELKWKYQADGCKACMLSHITSDLQILLDLRWALRSRATRAFVAKHGNPRLQPWVHVWIAALAGHVEKLTGDDIDLDAVILQNDEEAIEFKKVRARIAASKQQTHNYVEAGPGKAAAVAEVPQAPFNWSYPIHDIPHQPTPEENLAAHEAKGLEFEAKEAHPKGMYPHGISATHPCPEVAADTSHKRPSESAMSTTTVSADPSTKGRSPYQWKSKHRSSERRSLYSVDVAMDKQLHVVTEEDDERVHEAAAQKQQQEYVPPRSMWVKTPPPATDGVVLASSSLLPCLDTVEGEARPNSLTSATSWDKSLASVSSKGSWETGPMPSNMSSSFYAATTRAKLPTPTVRPSPSQSWFSLSNVAQQSYYDQPRQRQKSLANRHSVADPPRHSDPAETYTKLLHKSPFSDSVATLRQPQMGSSQNEIPLVPKAAQQNQVCNSQGQSPPARTSSRDSSLSSYSNADEGSGSDTSKPTNRHNLSAMTSRQVGRAPTPQVSAKRTPSESTEHFLRLYDEVVSAYLPEESLARQSAISKKTVRSQHNEKVNQIVDDITRGTAFHGDHKSGRGDLGYRQSCSTAMTPPLTEASTLSATGSDSSISTVIPESGRRRQRSKPRQDKIPMQFEDRPGARPGSSPGGSDESAQTRWSATYEEQIQSREDLGWFYGKEREAKQKNR